VCSTATDCIGPAANQLPPGDAFLADAAHLIEHEFGIGHATLQVELGTQCVDERCAP